MPPVSLVVRVAAPVAATLRCLEAVEAHTPPELYDVVLVDDAAPAETAELLAALGGDVRVVRHDRRQGAMASFAAGAAVAGGRYVALLDTDVVVTDGWLEPLVALLDAEPDVAVAQPTVVALDGSLLDAGGFVLRDGSVRPYGSGARCPGEPMHACRRDVTAVTGGCAVVRAEGFPLDGAYASPVWALTDLVAGGARAVLQPRSVVRRISVDAPRAPEGDAERLATRHPDVVATAPQPADDLGTTDWWALDADRPGGGRILVVDPWSPTFDRDTGHKRLLQMLHHLRRRGDGVVYYAETAMDRERYAPVVGDLGIPLYGLDPALRRQYDVDGALRAAHGPTLQQVLRRFRFDTIVFSFFSTAEKYLPTVRALAPDARVLVDSVDIHFLRERRMAEVNDDRALLARAEDTRRRELATYQAADRVVCVSESDADVLRRDLPGLDIALVPVAYEDVDQGPGRDERDRIVFVASSAHGPNLDAVRWWRDEIAPLLASRLPGVPLTVVGYDPQGTMAALAGPGVDVVGAVPDVLPWLHRSRLTAVPLRWGAGVKGKVIEAMMAGVPVVGTSIAVEGIGVVDGTHALVADDAEAFADAVTRAYLEPEMWSTLRREGRALVERDCSLDALGAALDVAIELPVHRGNRASRRLAAR